VVVVMEVVQRIRVCLWRLPNRRLAIKLSRALSHLLLKTPSRSTIEALTLSTKVLMTPIATRTNLATCNIRRKGILFRGYCTVEYVHVLLLRQTKNDKLSVDYTAAPSGTGVIGVVAVTAKAATPAMTKHVHALRQARRSRLLRIQCRRRLMLVVHAGISV
jgi:hypothetical protein